MPIEGYNHVAGIGINGECLPQAGNRLELSEEVDDTGLRKPRITFSYGPNERAISRHAIGLMTTIWETAGATDIWSVERAAHTIGTCRMGTDPENVPSSIRWGGASTFPICGSATTRFFRVRSPPIQPSPLWRSACGPRRHFYERDRRSVRSRLGPLATDFSWNTVCIESRDKALVGADTACRTEPRRSSISRRRISCRVLLPIFP